MRSLELSLCGACLPAKHLTAAGILPQSVCTSVNEVICHGIPDKRPLQNGDIVNVDISAFYGGLHSDLNETFVVGEVDEASKKLVKVTYEVCRCSTSLFLVVCCNLRMASLTER